MTRKRWLLVTSVIICITSVIILVVIGLQREAVSLARGHDDLVNKAQSSNQPVSFLPFPNDVSQSCDGSVAKPIIAGANPTPLPADIGHTDDAIPKSIVVGDVVQFTIVFDCAFSNLAAIAQMRDNSVQFKPNVSALDFDVDGVMADELAGLDFYCVEAPTDRACKNGSTTPAQDLKWTWFLRPKSVGRHFVRVQIYQRRIVGPKKYVEIAPRWVKEYSVDVQPPLITEMSTWLASIGALAGLFPVFVAIQKMIPLIQSWFFKTQDPARLSGIKIDELVTGIDEAVRVET